jgi:hypothetical protein
MAAFHHLNDQLFMPKSWLQSLPVDNELDIADVENAGSRMVRDPRTGERRWSTREDEFWERKGDEALKSGVYRSVRQHGIVNPVQLGVSGRTTEIRNGYHRVASADDHAFIPITYTSKDEVEGLPVHYDRVNENPVYPRPERHDSE